MTGYLRWLATRALGQGAGIRPARHPISLASGLQSEMRLPSEHADALVVDTGQFERSFGAPPQRYTEPLTSVDAAAPGVLPEPRLPSDPTSAEAKPGTLGSEASSYPMAARAAKEREEPRLVMDPQLAQAPRRRMMESERGGAEDKPPSFRDVKTPDPTPIDTTRRPQADQRPTAAPRIAARSVRDRPVDPRPSRSDAAPPPDVHIHIGRVELTAITPAATPARREPAAAAKKPMSLDEYLRQRGRRPS
ncbi:hypothetical protein C2U70_16020 [Bradyrhizobium guangdongense]|uniref:hypothetical protein n=1 Tax=Bradyrhizobium guangdongense TaxID=1325090 RepID=UPI0011270777|nr:hypothetical protein [Bradyrhizobium guangdongense]TPQ34855.1 hypothetical protein C2U70_16020 [Bradyrhizobium guangdongense]